MNAQTQTVSQTVAQALALLVDMTEVPSITLDESNRLYDRMNQILDASATRVGENYKLNLNLSSAVRLVFEINPDRSPRFDVTHMATFAGSETMVMYIPDGDSVHLSFFPMKDLDERAKAMHVRFHDWLCSQTPFVVVEDIRSIVDVNKPRAHARFSEDES